MPPAPSPGREPRFSLLGSVVCGLLLLVLGVFIVAAALERYPFFRLEQAEVSVSRFWGRELDAAAILPEQPRWQRTLALLSLSSERELLDGALRDLRALVPLVERDVIGDSTSQADPIRARLALTLAAAGRFPELDRLQGSQVDELRATLKAAYDRGPLPPPETRQRVRAVFEASPMDAQPRDWWQDQLDARLALREGDHRAAAVAHAAIRARGERVVRRAVWVTPIYLVPLLGLVLGAVALGRHRRLRAVIPGPLARAEVPLPFPAREALALLLRAALYGLLAAVPVIVVQRLLDLRENGALTLVSALPALFMVRRVLAAQGRSVSETLGLAPWPAGRWGWVTVVLIGLELAVGFLGSIVSAVTGGGSPTEGLLESAWLGSPLEAALITLEAVAWAPLFEEIFFRGLIYAALRRRFGIGLSALLSAVIFALVHAYSPAAFVTVAAGAAVSALVYERTRSLWPSILAHAFNNALVVVTSVAVYR